MYRNTGLGDRRLYVYFRWLKMKIGRLNLNNFRNYSNLKLLLNDRMNIFVGDNAQGKTNILESIIILALTKSHRITSNFHVISLGKSKSRIECTVKKDKLITKLKVDLSLNEKKIYINNNVIKKISDYISSLNVIIFTPNDLEIIRGAPNIRRNLLNIQLSQISKTYLNTYNEYNKILKTRNEYLKILCSNSVADRTYLDVITDRLIEKAIIIYQKRKEYIDLVNEKVNDVYKYITGEQGLYIKYVNNLDIVDYDTVSIGETFKKKLSINFKRELQYGMTLYGPHRDDFVFSYNENDLRIYGSQGQQKVAVLSFKLSEIPIFKNFSGFYPVLLLDDIFSELDVKKRNKLLKLINSYDIQSIITTTDLKSINKSNLCDSFIFEIKNANVERK